MATDKLFHQYSIQFGESLLRLLEIEDCKDYEAFSFTVKDIERRSDIVFENQRGKKRTIWIEFQGYRDELVFYRLNVAMSLYCQERTFFGEILPIVVFLKRSYLKAAQKLVYHFKGRRYLSFEPEVVVLGKKSVKELKDLKDIHLVPLYPLCDISSKEIKAYAPEWAEAVKQAKQLSTLEKKQILTLLGGFISHRMKELTLSEINKILGGFKMEDTQVGRDLIEIGFVKGIGKGIEEGVEKGHKQGKMETLFTLLSYKFGEIPEDIKNHINAISDETKLDDLAIKIIELTDLDKLKKLLN